MAYSDCVIGDRIRMTIGRETIDCYVFDRTDDVLTIYREFLDCGKPEKLETYRRNEVTAEVIESGGGIMHWASEEDVDAMIMALHERRFGRRAISQDSDDDLFKGGAYNAT